MNERDAPEYRCPAEHPDFRGQRCNGRLGRGRAEWFEMTCPRGHRVRIEGGRVALAEDARVPELAGTR